MKYFLLLLTSMATSVAIAQGPYCDDIQRLDQRPRLNFYQFLSFNKDNKKVDYIVVSKIRRKVYLLKEGVIVKSYSAAFGYNYLNGHKHFEGDNKTPEGIYSISAKNDRSAYHLALRISYPNAADIAYAKAYGKSPGGDIMIHGFPNSPDFRKMVQDVHPHGNWTTGCVGVTDPEIREIYNLVSVGTKIEICSSKKESP